MYTHEVLTDMELAPIIPMLGHQLQSEFFRMWRTPGFFISSLVLPAILYSFLGLRKVNVLQNGIDYHVYMLAAVATYGVVNVMLYSFGIGIAIERGQHINVLMRTTPLPASVYLLAKAITALISAIAMLLILSGFAVIAGGVQLNLLQWIILILSLVLGAIPFIALGFAIGNVVNSTTAAPIINLSFLIFAFASGIFIPVAQLPEILRTIAPYLPFYQLAQLAWSAVGVSTGSRIQPLLLLGLYGLIFLGIAIVSYRAEQRHSFN